jgi:hypothetical protein
MVREQSAIVSAICDKSGLSFATLASFTVTYCSACAKALENMLETSANYVDAEAANR